MPYFAHGISQQEQRIMNRKALSAHEKKEKAAVRLRDGRGCRWPHCRHWKDGVIVDAAHLEHAGMGGDPKAKRMRRDNLIRLCRIHHRGPVSLDSGSLRIEPLTVYGTEGPVKFMRSVEGYNEQENRYTCTWVEVAREIRVGVLEKHS
jgi:hypothetical protein